MRESVFPLFHLTQIKSSQILIFFNKIREPKDNQIYSRLHIEITTFGHVVDATSHPDHRPCLGANNLARRLLSNIPFSLPEERRHLFVCTTAI